MIKIKLCYENNFIKSFIVNGHANYESYGKDIVCASVSSIVITSINMALNLNSSCLIAEDKPGLIKCELLVKDKIINTVFDNMINMLQDLEKQYSKNIKIIKE